MRAAIIPIALTFTIGLRRAPLLGASRNSDCPFARLIPHKEFSFVYAALRSDLRSCRARYNRDSKMTATPARRPPGECSCHCDMWIMDRNWPNYRRDAGFWPNWRSHSGAHVAEEAIANDPALCGLGFRWPGVWYYWTGGDSYLRRPDVCIWKRCWDGAGSRPR